MDAEKKIQETLFEEFSVPWGIALSMSEDIEAALNTIYHIRRGTVHAEAREGLAENMHRVGAILKLSSDYVHGVTYTIYPVGRIYGDVIVRGEEGEKLEAQIMENRQVVVKYTPPKD